MATTNIPTKEHLAIVETLKDKYLRVRRGEDARADRPPSNGGNSSQETVGSPIHQSSQEVHSMALQSTPGERVGGQVKHPTVVARPSTGEVMDVVDKCITAILKPSCMVNDDPLPPLPTSHHELSLRDKRRGRWLAVTLRVEFDPACISLSYLEKARLVGLDEICGNDEEELVYNYMCILNDVEFVTNRKKALEAFEHEMDIPTAVCIAEAAKRDASFAIMRRRLRQMDKRHALIGDQKDQFGMLYNFLHGRTEAIGGNGNEEGEGFAGDNDGGEGSNDG